jgi:hypothetical protein
VLLKLSIDFVMASFQLSVDLLMASDGEAHARDDDYEDKCNQDKKQGQKLIRQSFNAEREAGRQQEERSRSNAERQRKKSCTEPTDQRCDYDCRKEGDVINAHDIRIDGEPECRGNCGTCESKGVGPDRSRPQGIVAALAFRPGFRAFSAKRDDRRLVAHFFTNGLRSGKGIGFADRPVGVCGASPSGALGQSGDLAAVPFKTAR